MHAATSIRLHRPRGVLGAAGLALWLAAIGSGCGSALTAGAAGGEREVTLAGWSDRAPELSLPLPEGFAVKSKKGEDFDVHYITLEGRRAADAHGTVYIGHGPNLFHKQRADEVEDVTSATETIGGRAVTVYSFSTHTQGTFHKEAILEGVFEGVRAGDEDVRGLLVHIACGGESRERVSDLWEHLIRVHVR